MRSPRIPPYAEPWSAPRRFVCLAVKATRSASERAALARLYAELGPERAAAAAVANQAESIVAHGLADAGIAGAPWDGWHAGWQARIGRLMALLDELAAAAAARGFPVVALKNGAIARALHRCPACVPMGDLDLLVRRRDFAPMHALLRARGFAVVADGVRPADLDAGLVKGGLDYRLDVDGEPYAIDLQWRPVSGRWLRADQEPGADELIERSIAIPRSAARMLAPTDNLIQVALHTAKHSYCRAPGFRLHLDVDRLVHATPLDWDAVVAGTRRLGVATPVFLSLSIPRGLFGTAVPDRVLAALAPPRARRWLLYRWLASASVFEPGRRKFTRLGQLAFHTALADGTGGVWRTAFPPPAEMRERHRAGRGTPGLVLGYGRRLAEVVLRYQA
jgi:hypothetical protein